jgi:hypothetical protein
MMRKFSYLIFTLLFILTFCKKMKIHGGYTEERLEIKQQ